MKSKLFVLVSLILLITGCSLAEDVTPPPALATAQAAPVDVLATEAPPSTQVESETIVIAVPVSAPNLISGAAIYLNSCEPCHGPMGVGGGSKAENLQVEPPPIGDIEHARQAMPIDWYQVVTEGRMDRFMPPFQSLSDTQRWDVVAYVFSLSHPLETRERGAELYLESCATCHGDRGQGGQGGPAIDTGEIFAKRSLDMLLETIRSGKGNMPAFGEAYSEEEQLILASYVQSLGTILHGATAAADEATEAIDATGSGSTSGMIMGTVSNGTEGATLPGDLVVTVVGLEGNIPVLEQEVPLGDDGTFSLDGIEIQPGRIYGVLVEYQDVIYFSVGGHLLEEEPLIELPVVIYETTADESALSVQRLHLIFDFSIEGLVDVSELWLLSTEGDRTVAGAEGLNEIPIRLPEGFTNLRFAETVTPDQFIVSEDGIIVREPVRPGEPLEVVISFTLPYSRSLDLIQPLDLPVEAVVLLTENDAPEIQGDLVQDVGERDMGGIILHMYEIPALEAGDQLELRLRGAHPLSKPDLSTSNLVIGLGVFGVVLIGVGVALWIWQRRSNKDVAGFKLEDAPALDRNQLLRAIASLDDVFEAGELEEAAYRERRAALKSQLMEMMDADGD